MHDVTSDQRDSATSALSRSFDAISDVANAHLQHSQQRANAHANPGHNQVSSSVAHKQHSQGSAGRKLAYNLQTYSDSMIQRQQALRKRAIGNLADPDGRTETLAEDTAEPQNAPTKTDSAANTNASASADDAETNEHTTAADAPNAPADCMQLTSCFASDRAEPNCTGAGRSAAPGQLFSFAKDSNRLSLGRQKGSAGLPRPVDTEAATFKFVAAGGHNAVIDESGVLWTWGRNNSAGGGGFGSESIPDSGQLGNAREADASESKPAVVSTSQRFVAADCGRYHSAAITADGRVVTWGLNDFGQLGRPGADGIATPCNGGAACHSADIAEAQGADDQFASETFVAVATGRYHTVAAAESGAVYTAGLNFCGNSQVGLDLQRICLSVLNAGVA